MLAQPEAIVPWAVMRYGEATFSLIGARNYGRPVVPVRLDLLAQRPLELLPEQCPQLPELAL